VYVIVCSIKPQKGLIELFVITEDRQITAVWMPKKYPKRARIEKIIRGKSLDREQFIALATAIPAIVGDAIRGKTVEQLQELIGHTFHLDWDIEAPLVAAVEEEG